MRFTVSFLALLTCTSCFSAPCIHYLECPEGMQDCHALAYESCPGGYNTLDGNNVGSDFSGFAEARLGNATTPHILVTCK